jgi:protocatechuate 3,4-dioxygenase beta subunit
VWAVTERGNASPEQHEDTMNDNGTHEIHDHDRGLTFDLSTLVNRRRLLLGAAGSSALALLAACSSSTKSASTTSTGATSTTAAPTTTTSPAATGASTASTTASTAGTAATTAAAADLSPVPEETAGPFPGDGSNGTQVLTESGIVRSNIRTSFGSSTTDAGGVNSTIQLTVLDASTGQPVPGAAVYIWHCDVDGNYSMYSQGVTGENYLRGVQETDTNGLVTFLSYYPACYSGRWPHIHYEVYPSIDSITNSSNKIATSQLAMLDEINKVVFAESLYSGSLSSYAQVSLASDMVFSDGTTNEVPTVTGSVADGYTMAMNVPVSV